MSITVTGGAGFIGSHLVKQLISKGEKVVVVDDFSTGTLDNLNYLGVGNVEIKKVDLTNYEQAQQAILGTDTLFHMAARVGGINFLHGQESVEFSTLTTNLAIDSNVFRACLETGVKKIIYPSSVAVYSLSRQNSSQCVFVEDDFSWPQNKDFPFKMNLDPDQGYGLAKVLGEIELYLAQKASLKQNYKLKVGIARIFSAYGENEPLGQNAHVIARLIKSAINYPKQKMIIWGNGQQSRDYVYVTDCAKALIEMADYLDKQEPEQPLILNIGSGQPTSINDLAHKIIEISKKDIVPIYQKEKIVGPFCRVADISKIKRILGWQPEVSLTEGLERTYNWAEKKLKI